MCYQVIPGMTCQNQKDKGRNEITESLHKKNPQLNYSVIQKEGHKIINPRKIRNLPIS